MKQTAKIGDLMWFNCHDGIHKEYAIIREIEKVGDADIATGRWYNTRQEAIRDDGNNDCGNGTMPLDDDALHIETINKRSLRL